MMAKLKAAKEKGAAKVEEAKAQHQAKQEAKWREETMDGEKFKPFNGWRDVYEPVKEKKEKESSGPNAVEKAAAKKMTENITRDIIKALMETVSKLLGPAAAALAGSDKELSDVINAADGAVLTYRFAYKGEKKMAYLRTLAADRLALALGAAFAKEQAAKGHDAGASLSPEQVKEIVDSLVARVNAEVEKKQAEAVEALKASPLFAASGADGAQVDAGVVALQDFLRGYMESKVGAIVKVLETVLNALLVVAEKHKDAIKEHAAKAGGDSFAEGSDAFKAASADVLGEIEKAYGQLNDAVAKYVGDLVGMIMLGGGDDEAAE